jgi:hypothetical protein
MTFKCSVCGVDRCTMEVPGLNDNMNDTTYCNVLGVVRNILGLYYEKL